jgi:hypothetical protein
MPLYAACQRFLSEVVQFSTRGCELGHNSGACAPSRMTQPTPPWFWIESLSKIRATIPPAHASAARYAADRLAKKTDGLVTADTSGTHSIPEASAQPASIRGLKRSVSHAADGRRTPIGTQADPALNEAIAEVRSRYRSLYDGRCRSQCVCVATVHIPLK